mgnify:CR=1 FL=1
MGYYWAASSLIPFVPEPVLGVPLITGSSRPVSASELDTIIELVEAEVAGAAAEAGYAFPVSTAASVGYNFVKQVVSDGAVGKTLRQINPNSKAASELLSAFNNALEKIRRGQMPLLGAGLLTSEQGGRALPRGVGIASPWITATWTP